MMRVKLKVLKGAGAGKVIPIPVAKFFVGRGEDCHLRPKSDSISRHHCAIVTTDNQVAVRDFGSKNGTYVNGKRIENACVLNEGDNLVIGPLEFEIVIEKRSGKRPKVRDMKDVAERSAQSSTGDADVTNWLDDAIAEDSTDVTVTRQFKFSDKSPDELAAETTAKLDDDTDPGDTAESEAEAEAEDGSSIFHWPKKKKTPGKLPKKEEADEVVDSRDAAANTLRDYFNRS
jgi:pSer/pThr/pTyr-binding forkhead associated (FHA) protein